MLLATEHTEPMSHLSWAGVKFFEELDRDADGKVSLEDMKVAMRKRKLPEKYAHEFVHRARGGRWWSNTIRYLPHSANEVSPAAGGHAGCAHTKLKTEFCA